jgi:hypothetical protein
MASSFWASTHASIADASRLWFAIFLLVGIIWAVLNWFLSTAGVFVATEGQGSLSAIGSCGRLCVESTGRVLAVGVWFGLPHLGAFISAWGAGFTVLSTIGAWRMGPALVLEFLIIAVYCAVADFLYTGRLAAYIAIVRGPEIELLRETSPDAPTSGQTAVDRDEVILSDVPLLAT